MKSSRFEAISNSSDHQLFPKHLRSLRTKRDGEWDKESRETQTLASNSSLSFECKESRRVFSDFNKVLYSINLLKKKKSNSKKAEILQIMRESMLPMINANAADRSTVRILANCAITRSFYHLLILRFLNQTLRNFLIEAAKARNIQGRINGGSWSESDRGIINRCRVTSQASEADL